MTRSNRAEPSLIDRIYELMLNDPTITYENIGRLLRVTRQRVGQIARKLGVDGRHRQRERTLRSQWFAHHRGYPADVRAVAREIGRLGLKVLPYRPLLPSGETVAPTWKRTLLIEGVPCRIHCRKPRRTTPNGREYAMFPISGRTREPNVAVFAFWRRGKIKLFVIPTRELKKVSTLWLPADGRYAENHNNKPKRDWTVYEGAWHLLKQRRRRRA